MNWKRNIFLKIQRYQQKLNCAYDHDIVEELVRYLLEENIVFFFISIEACHFRLLLKMR